VDATTFVRRDFAAMGIEPPVASVFATSNTFMETHKHHKVKFINWIMVILLLAILLAGIVGATYWVLTTPQFTIAKIHIGGEVKRTTTTAIQDTLTRQITGNFFVLNLNTIQQALETLPWIAEAHIRRVWPLTLDVWLRERDPLAKWGDNSLVTNDGIIFTPDAASIPPDLIHLYAPNNTVIEVINNYLWLNTRLINTGLRISKLTLSERHAWYVDFANGLHLSIGVRDFPKRIDKFLKYLADLPQPEALAEVDLRYPNGFTAKWQPQGSTP
jgi:cell division protein FtsQ